MGHFDDEKRISRFAAQDEGEDDRLVQNFERNVIELTNRGFVFTEEGRLITMDDLKLAHERAEGDQESIEQNFKNQEET